MQGPELLIPPHLEVVHIGHTQGGPFPGLFLLTGMARMVRPVLHNGLRSPELIGSLEQSTLDVRSPPLRPGLAELQSVPVMAAGVNLSMTLNTGAVLHPVPATVGQSITT